MAANGGMQTLPPTGTMMMVPPKPQEGGTGVFSQQNVFGAPSIQDKDWTGKSPLQPPAKLIGPQQQIGPQYQKPQEPAKPFLPSGGEGGARDGGKPRYGAAPQTPQERVRYQKERNMQIVEGFTSALGAFDRMENATGIQDYSLLPPAVSIPDMRVAGLTAADMTSMNYFYDQKTATWQQLGGTFNTITGEKTGPAATAGGGGGGTQVSGINPWGAQQTTESGRAMYWKKKKSGKYELTRYRSRSERNRGGGGGRRRRQGKFDQVYAPPQPEIPAAVPMNVLELKMGSG